jgi:RNA ligase
MSEKPLHHQTNIVRIPEPRVHTNADTLELFDIGGYQVVAKKGNFKPGDFAIYIQPDSVVPQTEPFKWLWEDMLKRPEMCQHLQDDGTPAYLTHMLADSEHTNCLRCMATLINGQTALPAKRRRITIRKFRKEVSEGMLMPLTDFPNELGSDKAPMDFVVPENGLGTDVSDLLGITHYEPEDDGPEGNSNAPRVKARRPKTLKGWLRFFWYRLLHITHIKRNHASQAITVAFDSPHYDVAAMKAARTGFRPEEMVVATEKLHGSSARYVVLDGVQYIGSHFQWKDPQSSNIFTRAFAQHPWIGEWCRSNPGRILYGEVVGDQKGFTYGYDKAKGQLGFYAFDIREPNGTWTKPYDVPEAGLRIQNAVPILYLGVANRLTLNELAETPKSSIDAKTTREGIVVTRMHESAEARSPRQLKLVSSKYYEETSK